MKIIKILMLLITLYFGLQTFCKLGMHYGIFESDQPVEYPAKNVILQIVLTMICILMFYYL